MKTRKLFASPALLPTLVAVALAGWACAPGSYDQSTEDAESAEAHEGAESGGEYSAASAVFAEIEGDLVTVEEKLVGLAEAMGEEAYQWRPMEGVRSAAEMFMHVTADNYLFPAFGGAPLPEHTGMTATEYETVLAFERSITDRQAIIDEMKASFAHLREALAAVDPATAGDEVEFFGRSSTVLGLWFLAAVHLHEHLGNGITYARANEVVPPWSRSEG